MSFLPISGFWSRDIQSCFQPRKKKQPSSAPPSPAQVPDGVQKVELQAPSAPPVSAPNLAQQVEPQALSVPSGPAELLRRADFIKAVRQYNWDGAHALASTPQEKEDVADSKNRVDWMEYFLAQGDSMQAMMYAITSEERQKALPPKDDAAANDAALAQEAATIESAQVIADLSQQATSSSVKATATTESDEPSKESGSRVRILSRIGSAARTFRRMSSKPVEAGLKESDGEVNLRGARF